LKKNDVEQKGPIYSAIHYIYAAKQKKERQIKWMDVRIV
jgi:hypothetical protein